MKDYSITDFTKQMKLIESKCYIISHTVNGNVEKCSFDTKTSVGNVTLSSSQKENYYSMYIEKIETTIFGDKFSIIEDDECIWISLYKKSVCILIIKAEKDKRRDMIEKFESNMQNIALHCVCSNSEKYTCGVRTYTFIQNENTLIKIELDEEFKINFSITDRNTDLIVNYAHNYDDILVRGLENCVEVDFINNEINLKTIVTIFKK